MHWLQFFLHFSCRSLKKQQRCVCCLKTFKKKKTNFNFHPPYLQYMQPEHFTQLPQAVNVPQQVEELEGKKSKRDKWTKAQTNILVAIWKENLSDIESSKANLDQN